MLRELHLILDLLTDLRKQIHTLLLLLLDLSADLNLRLPDQHLILHLALHLGLHVTLILHLTLTLHLTLHLSLALHLILHLAVCQILDLVRHLLALRLVQCGRLDLDLARLAERRLSNQAGSSMLDHGPLQLRRSGTRKDLLLRGRLLETNPNLFARCLLGVADIIH